MARYRKVDPKIWGDAKVRRLSAPEPNGRDCWLYLLTARESTPIPGVIPAGAYTLAESLRWSVEGFRESFGELFREGLAKADWEAQLVWLPNAIKYNLPENPNVVRGWGKLWPEVPESPLKNEIYQALKAAIEPLGEGFAKGFQEGFGQGLANQEQEQEQEQEEALSAAPTGPRPADLQKLWNDTAHHSLPRWKEMPEKRRRTAAARLKDRDLASWAEVISKINTSAFCRGENDRGWRASPDWLLQPESATRVLEGKYDRAGSTPAADGGPVFKLVRPDEDPYAEVK